MRCVLVSLNRTYFILCFRINIHIWNVIHGNANHFRESLYNHITHSVLVFAFCVRTAHTPPVWLWLRLHHYQLFFSLLRTKYNQSKWILVSFLSSTIVPTLEYAAAAAVATTNNRMHFYHLFIERGISLFASAQAPTVVWYLSVALCLGTNRKHFNICIDEFCFI